MTRPESRFRQRRRVLRGLAAVPLAACAAAGAVSGAGAAAAPPTRAKSSSAGGSARDKFVGAWRLAWMEEPGPDGTIRRISDRKGSLMYTPDGRTSVQIQFPESQSAVSNDYVLNGYEASFGTFEVNEEAQTITRQVEGSITPGLVGKRLTRSYRFSDGRLIVRSVRPEERWSVIWERY